MANFRLAVEIFQSVEHLVEEQASCILTKALSSRVFYQVEHVQEVASEILGNHVNVRIVTVFLSLHVHDTFKVVTKHANEVLMLKLCMVFNLPLHLLFV